MKNTNKMKKLTNDLKAFEQMMKEKHKDHHFTDIEVKIGTTEEDAKNPSDDLNDAFLLILETVQLIGKAVMKVKYLEDKLINDEGEACTVSDNCPYSGDCGSTYGTMVLVARPDGDNTIMTMDELAEEIGDIFAGQTGTYDMHPIPGTEDLYYTIAEKKPLKRGSKTYYKAPAVIFGIDEEAGEVVSPNARQLYAAARYFEEHSTTIRTREGSAPVFCFD